MKFCECLNCGSQIRLQNGHCICCRWSEGEEPFKPWWMPEDVWLTGRRTGWLPLKKAGKEQPPNKHALAILESIRNLKT